MADKPVKPEQVLKIEPRSELHFKGKCTFQKCVLECELLVMISNLELSKK